MCGWEYTHLVLPPVLRLTATATATQRPEEYNIYFPAVAAFRAVDTDVSAGNVGRGAGLLRRPYPAPRDRLSAAALLAGRYVLVMGGFSVEHREMGDVWVSLVAAYLPVATVSEFT